MNIFFQVSVLHIFQFPTSQAAIFLKLLFHIPQIAKLIYCCIALNIVLIGFTLSRLSCKQNLLPFFGITLDFCTSTIIHFLHVVLNNELTIGSIRIHHMGQPYSLMLFLLIHIPTFVFLMLTFFPFLTNAIFHFQNFYSKFIMVSLVKTKLFTYKILFIKSSLAFSVTTSTMIQTVRAATLIPGVHQLSQKISLIIQIQPELLLLLP